jgi:Chaperone of endosialidase
MNPLIQSKNTTILPVLIALTLGCFALSPVARAVCREGCDNGNTFLGEDALLNNTGGINTAIGLQALWKNTTGFLNTAIGQGALSLNTTGSNNTATGNGALFANQGDNNTANGEGALNENITGDDNTATGFHALFRNHVGDNNTATGAGALEGTINGITGSNNTATGTKTLFVNTFGFDNTATGFVALYANTEGFNNTANGVNALSANTTGNNNIAIGRSAGMNLTTGSNNIDIGHQGNAGEANTIRIGTQETHTRTFIAGINGTALRFGVAVRVDAAGQLGTIPSSARFKQNIKPMDKASEAVLALKPVTFRYKKELDPDGIPQFGLVAEEVEKVNPDLVVRDAEGKPYTVCYETVNVMLLNEFLKEHKKVEKLESVVASLAATVKEQATQIQKVSAQLEASKPAPQVVNNP